MSILLDALKKSEEQRQLGQAPSIHSPSGDVGERRAGGSQWIPLAMMGLAAVAMAWFGWQQLRQPPIDAAAGPAMAADSAADDSATTGGSEAAAAVETATGPVARRPQLVANPAVRTPVESLDARKDEKTKLAEPPVTADASDGGRQRADLNRSFRDFKPNTDESREPAAAPQEAAAPQVAETAGEEPVQQPAGSQSAEPAVTEPISYWELPQSVRDALPELRITVLVYADRPENRFVLIEGQRVVEKDQLSDGVVLEEIRRDGAVFEYRNYRFLVEG